MPYDGVSRNELLDLIASVSNDLPQTDLPTAFDHHDYEVVNELATKEKTDVTGGTEWKRRVMLDKSGQASFVNPYEETEPVQRNLLTTMTVPWKLAQTYYLWEKTEILDLLGEGRLVDEIMARDQASIISICDMMEEQFFETVNLADGKRPYGLKYWFPILDAGQDTEGGFYGGCPTGETAVGGITPSGQNTTTLLTTAGVKDKWNHWQAGGPSYFQDVGERFMQTLRIAHKRIHFRAPKLVNGKVTPYSSRFKIYTSMDLESEIEWYLSDTGDTAVGGMTMNNDGELRFKRSPVKGIDILDDDTYQAVWFIDLNVFMMVVKKGDNMAKADPESGGSRQHRVVVQYTDHQYNFVCKMRRKCAAVSRTA